MNEKRDRVLLLLPTSTYRTSDFMAAASRLRIAVVVGSNEPSTMESMAPDSLITLDFLDPEAAAEEAARFHRRYPLSAVVSTDEETEETAAAICHRIGLPHNPPEAARRARWKHEMRAALERAEVPGPGYELLDIGEPAPALAARLSYPVVLKPVFLSGSRGVIRADDRAEGAAALERIERLLSRPELRERGGAMARRVLAEDYLPGEEVAVEGLLTDGKLDVLAIFDKPDPMEGPFFEETIYVTPSRLPEPEQRALGDLCERAARAIGLVQGPVHAELRLGPGGISKVIEIAGRSIGGLCSRTLKFGLGMSLEELILRHRLGMPFDRHREQGAAGVMMIPIPRAGRLVEIRGLEAARGLPHIESLSITVPLGSELVPLPEGASYLGFIFARAPGAETVEAALRAAHRELVFSIGGA